VVDKEQPAVAGTLPMLASEELPIRSDVLWETLRQDMSKSANELVG